MVQAPGEAEATCAALNRDGFVDACATNDSDVLLFGAQTAFHTLKPLVSPLPRDMKLTSAYWQALWIDIIQASDTCITCKAWQAFQWVQSSSDSK